MIYDLFLNSSSLHSDGILSEGTPSGILLFLFSAKADQKVSKLSLRGVRQPTDDEAISQFN